MKVVIKGFNEKRDSVATLYLAANGRYGVRILPLDPAAVARFEWLSKGDEEAWLQELGKRPF